MRKAFMITAAALFVSGCASSSEEIAKHFESMNQIAKQYESQCDQMGQSLTEYLNQNQAALSEAIQDVSSTKPSEAQKIYTTSLELHQLTYRCHTPSIETFKANLSQIVLQNTISQK